MSILQRVKSGWNRLQAFFYRWVGHDYQCQCGHTARWKTILTIDGWPGVYTLPSRTPGWCPTCWANAAIKCAWCDEAIRPGDPITLYTPAKADFQVPEHAVVYKREPRLQLVGCLRWNCSEAGADRAGFWIMPGKVQRVMTPLEEVIAHGGDQVMLFPDLADPQRAIPISDEEAYYPKDNS